MDTNRTINQLIEWCKTLFHIVSAEGLAEFIRAKSPVTVPLSPSQPHKEARQDARWRLLPNEKVEPEL